ncbi:MAG TPA: BlaI/MecI/CopY family transcriptional regulator [Tepidisphaeraceae bacterium]|nr:BlaI/MecI/CopY family transcriptional regulator [Tepidisphaeraceae bacterium]
MNKSSIRSLSPGQLEVMNVVWNLGEAGVAEVWGEISARRKVARNTVQTIMARLVEAGWLEHRLVRGAHLYRAARSRQRTVSGLVSRLVDSAFGGSATGLVLTLLEGERLSRNEADRLRELIDRAEKRGKP